MELCPLVQLETASSYLSISNALYGELLYNLLLVPQREGGVDGKSRDSHSSSFGSEGFERFGTYTKDGTAAPNNSGRLLTAAATKSPKVLWPRVIILELLA